MTEDRKPLRCIVTAVRQGRVYWKQEGEKKSHMCFKLDMADEYVMPNVALTGPRVGHRSTE